MKISNSLEISNLHCFGVVFVALDNPKATKKGCQSYFAQYSSWKVDFLFSYVALDMLKNMKKALYSSLQTKDDKNPIYDFELKGPQ